MSIIGGTVFYWGTLIVSAFTFFMQHFGTGIGAIYLDLNYWGVLVGMGAYQGLTMLIMAAGAALTELSQAWRWVATWLVLNVGMYVGYALLMENFQMFYVQTIYKIMLYSKAEAVAAESSAETTEETAEEPAEEPVEEPAETEAATI